MFETARARIAAVVAMATCCGLSMALALGLVAFSSTLLAAGTAVAIVVGCLVFMAFAGHSRRSRQTATTSS